MKSLFKQIAVAILGNQVRRLRRKNNFKIIGVVGSIGKTSTKLAIAKVLGSQYRVRYQVGNYNDLVSVPLIFFGETIPAIWNIFAWLLILVRDEIQIFFDYPFDFVVVELGTDGPGQIGQFRKYLKLDVVVVTAVTAEHMEFFGSLDRVAEEEWSVGYFSDLIFVNRDFVSIIPEEIGRQKIVFYGKNFGSNFKIENVERKDGSFYFDLLSEGKKVLSLSLDTVSEVSIYSATIAAVLAAHFKVAEVNIQKVTRELRPFAGRMQKLAGVRGSVIIDDTYNASPESMKIALDTLYQYPRPKKIAILGMMNELGQISKVEHERVGEYCDPKLLNLVVTVGKDANEYLAKSARKNGCEVYEAKSAQDAGWFVLEKIDKETVILVKGSQNGVFAEEAVKVLLKHESDVSKLVRQDKDWLSKKSIDF